MRYTIGVALFLTGAWLLYAGLAHRRRARAQPQAATVPTHPSLALMGSILPPLVITFLGFVGLKSTLAYAMLSGAQLFSLFDLAGFLFLLAGYGTWLTLRTRYGIAATPAEAGVASARLRVIDGSEREIADHELADPDPARTAPGVRRGAGVRDVAADLAPAGEAAERAERRRRTG